MTIVHSDAADLDALQATLGQEYAAVFFYGAAQAKVPLEEVSDLTFSDTLAARLADHQRRRDTLLAAVIAAGARPVASAPTYRLPDPMTTLRQVRDAARVIEEASASHYAWLIGSSDGTMRAWALTALTAAAQAMVEFGGAPGPFPGAEELAR